VTTHLNLVLRLIINGAVLPISLRAIIAWCIIKNRDNYKSFIEFQNCVFPTIFRVKDVNLIFNGP
jgi:hypothetical protein